MTALKNMQSDSDIIYITGLSIATTIGIYAWERRIRQTVVLDLELATDIRKAAESDAIEDTLNYKAIAKRLTEFVGSAEFQLVETLAERIAAVVLDEFAVQWLRLRVNKRGAVSAAVDVGIVIERGTRP